MIDTKRSKNAKQGRSELRILDYRNAKYQGMTEGSNLQPSGMGMALNQDFLFAIGLWKKSKIDGEAFIIYPDQSIFYGFFKGNLPYGICCYEVARKMQIFALLQISQEDLFVLDWKGTKTLLFLSINRTLRGKLYQKASSNEYILIQEANQNSNSLKNVQIVKQYRYNTSDQKWDAIEKYFKQIVKIQMKSYKHFLRYHFNSQISTTNLKLQIVQLKDEVQINFRDTSIMCKITDNHSSTNDFKVKMVGFFDHEQREMDFYRKQARFNTIEQGVKGQIITYNKHEHYRPLNCLKQLKRYYRQSLNFKNQFLNLEPTKKVKNIFEAIQNYVNYNCTNNYAQKLLQNPRISSPSRVQIKQNKEFILQNSERNAEEDIPSLREIKQNIYQQAKHKKESRRDRPNYLQRQQFLQRKQINNYKYSDHADFVQRKQFVDSPQIENYIIKEPKQQIYSQKIRQNKYLQQYPQKNQPFNKFSKKKSYVYLLDDSLSEKNEIQNNQGFDDSSIKLHIKEEQLQRDHSSHVIQALENHYEDFDYKKSHDKKRQHLKSLVYDYEAIQNRLKNEFPPIILNQYEAYLQKRKVLDQVYKNATYQEEIKNRSPSYQKNKSVKKYSKKESDRSPSPIKKGRHKASWK